MPYSLLNDQGDYLVDIRCTCTVDTLRPMNRAPSVLLRLGNVAIAGTKGDLENKGKSRGRKLERQRKGPDVDF